MLSGIIYCASNSIMLKEGFLVGLVVKLPAKKLMPIFFASEMLCVIWMSSL